MSAKSDVVELSKRQAKAKAKKTAREKQKAAAQARIKHALGVKRAAQLENCVTYCLQQKPPIISARGIFSKLNPELGFLGKEGAGTWAASGRSLVR